MDSLRTGSIRWGRGAGWDGERGLRALLVVFVGLLFFVVPAGAQYGGGSGTAEDPYLIYTPEQMNAIGAHESDWDKHFKLMADIDLGGYTGDSYNLIGYWDEGNSVWVGFSGVFEGNGHTISNFTYHRALAEVLRRGVGVISVVCGEGAEVRNLRLIDPDVNVPLIERVGALAGYVVEGTIQNCRVEGGTVSGETYVGGLAGACHEGDSLISYCQTSCGVSAPDGGAAGLVAGIRASLLNGTPVISHCSSSGSISGHSAAGLVWVNTGVISNCHATATVSARYGAGGLVLVHLTDDNYPDGLIIDCYATGDVSGHSTVGGLISWNQGRVVRSYATGTVSATSERAGGLVGFNDGSEADDIATISSCYATGDVSGSYPVGGLVGLNYGADISDSYALGRVFGGYWDRGGLVGINESGAHISRCYSAGFVEPGDILNGVGGLVGRNLTGSSVSASFWDTQTSGLTASAGGTGRTTAQMQNRNTFVGSGWDFVGETANGTDDIWAICNGADYPRLLWQFVLGDFDGDGDVDFVDFALMAAKWLKADSALYCSEPGCDITGEGTIDTKDLREFCENWLTGVE